MGGGALTRRAMTLAEIENVGRPMMVFALCGYGHSQTIPITRNEYADLKRAKDSYVWLVRVEENFDAVMENHAELEQTILSFGVRYLAFSSEDDDRIHEIRRTLSRRLLHVLATARLYRNALAKHGKALLKPDSRYGDLESALRDSSNHPMSFRVVEALRNYSQHNELPISGMNLSSAWENEDKKVRLKERSAYTILPKIDARAVAKERDLPPDVRDALQKLGDRADMMGHIREYVEHLGSINDLFRKLVKNPEDAFIKTLQGAIARYKSLLGPADRLFAVVARNSDEPGVEIQIFDKLFDSLARLRRKNRTQRNLSKSYVKWTGLTW
jgi:hypothetical protein